MTDDIRKDSACDETASISKVDNPWREFIENCIDGSNYFRSSEYYQLLADLDRLYRIESATTPAEVEPIPNAPLVPAALSWATAAKGWVAGWTAAQVVGNDKLRTLAHQLSASEALLAEANSELVNLRAANIAYASEVANLYGRAGLAEAQLAEAARRLEKVEEARIVLTKENKSE